MADKPTVAMQQNWLTLLCYSDEHGKIVANLFDAELFEGEERVIAERAINFWRKYNKPPKEHTADLVADIIEDRDNPRSQTYRALLVQILQFSEKVNEAYSINALVQKVTHQRQKQTLIKIAEHMNQRGDASVEEVSQMFYEVARVKQVGFDPGMSGMDYKQVLEYLRKREVEFSTGIKEFDNAHVTPARGAVMLFCAPTGRGKSWFLNHVGMWSLNVNRKKVCHITMELGAEEVLQRYYQMAFAISKYEKNFVALDIPSVKLDRWGEFAGIERKKITPEFALDSKEVDLELDTRINNRMDQRWNNIKIKKFPMGSLNMQGIEVYLDNLEATDGFIPDIVLLDYIGVMKKNDRLQEHTDLGRTLEQFKGLCEERNVAGVTAHQVSRAGAMVDDVKITHVAGSWMLTNVADMVFLYSQNEFEKGQDIARVFIAKARSEADQFGTLILQKYATGQFCLDSMFLKKKYYEWREEQKGDDDDTESSSQEEED